MKQKLFIIPLIVGVLLLQGFSAYAKPAKDDRIPGQYIVVLKDDVKDVDLVAGDIEKKHRGVRIATYQHALKGFAVNMTSEEAEKVKKDSRVKFVSEDRVVNILGRLENAKTVVSQAQVAPTGIKRIGAVSTVAKGLGITVAVIDTGIDLAHPDLAANILNSGKSCIRQAKTAKDDNGHGTHVAGTIAPLVTPTAVIR